MTDAIAKCEQLLLDVANKLEETIKEQDVWQNKVEIAQRVVAHRAAATLLRDQRHKREALEKAGESST